VDQHRAGVTGSSKIDVSRPTPTRVGAECADRNKVAAMVDSTARK
jgi:hypothetical protein